MITKHKYYFNSADAAQAFENTRQSEIATSIHHEDRYWPRGSNNKYKVWVVECWWPTTAAPKTQAA